MRWVPAVVFALAGVAAAQEEYKGKHFDCFGKDKAQVEKRGKQADEVGERFGKIMGITPKRGGVVLSGLGGVGPDGKKNGAKWTFSWPDAFGNFGNLGGLVKAEDMDPFTHELGHMIFVEHVNDKCDESLKKRFNGYGSYVKDWLDEAFACIQEPEGMKNTRRQQIKGHVNKGDHIPFKKLFEMDHPMAGKKSAGGDMPGGEFGGLGQNPGQMTEVNKFYVECLSVMEFLLDQYGEGFVRHVVDQHAKAKNMGDALKSYKGKLKKAKLAKDVDELEKQWIARVKAR